MTCKMCQAYEAELADYAQTVTKLRQELAECRKLLKEDRYEAEKPMGHGRPHRSVL